jgi:hypothetical protein
MASKYFQVVSREGVRVRTSPEVGSNNAIRSLHLSQGHVLEVRAESRRENGNYVWWEHAQNPGYWSASEQIRPRVALMEPYTPPFDVDGDQEDEDNESKPPITPGTVLAFEVVAATLQVRSAPSLGNTIVPGQALRRGSRLRVVAASKTLSAGLIWYEHADRRGWWSAAGSASGTPAYLMPASDDPPDVDAYELTVPWFTQVQTGNNLRNDCGHACVLMLLRYYDLGSPSLTVPDLYRLPFKNANGTTTHQHLQKLAAEHKLTLAPFTRPSTAASLETIRASIRQNRPTILLVWYPSLKFRNPANGPFNHWVVVTGFQGSTFYLNDPLWVASRDGARRPIQADVLLNACGRTSMGVYGAV